MSALAGYLAVAQLAQHLDLALPDDIAAGEHVTLGVRSVRPDGRSSHDPSFRWPWPGNWTPRIDADASAAECSHGLHIALGWRGLSATGPVHVCQIVGYRAADVAHVGATKLRVSQAAVLDVWDVHRMARDGNLRRRQPERRQPALAPTCTPTCATPTCSAPTCANLSGANLRSAKLRRPAAPTCANQRRPALRRPDLRGADLRGANLRANLAAPTCAAPTCANLRRQPAAAPT
jgi:hypothetical protein